MRALSARGILAVLALSLPLATTTGCSKVQSAWRGSVMEALWNRYIRRIPAQKPVERRTLPPPALGRPVEVLGGFIRMSPPKGWYGEGQEPQIRGFAYQFRDRTEGTLEFTRLPRTPAGLYKIYGVNVNGTDATSLIEAVKAMAQRKGANIVKAGDLGPITIGGEQAMMVHLTYQSAAGPITILHWFIDLGNVLVVARYSAPAQVFPDQLSNVEDSMGTARFSGWGSAE